MSDTISLRDYQTAAVNAVERELLTVKSTLLVLATGLGKTVVFSALCSRVAARGGRCLVLAHRAELLAQAERTARAFGLSTGIECADKRVDPSALPCVTIASVQTLKGKRLESFPPNAFELIVVDEAHHSPAKSYRTITGHFVAARVLGVTATPSRLDGVGLRAVFESVAYEMDLRTGIAQGWLCPIELRSVKVEPLDLSNVRSVAGELHAGELETELLRDSVLHEIARPLAEQSAGRQTLAFVVGVAQAHALADTLCESGVRAAAVDGSMCAETRAQVLADYRSGRLQVVCNAMLWTEGFDAPETSCIALVRPTRSRSLLLQQIGRGTRRSPETGKTSCLVLDFVPGRFSSVRLASPADALAGEDLPDDIAAAVRDSSTNGQLDIFDAIDTAKVEAAATEEAKRAARAERLRKIDVRYEVARLDIAALLEVVEPEPTGGRDASMFQIEALRKAGLNVPSDISLTAASKLLDIVKQRRDAGLCSIKQARKLRNYRLPDDLTFQEARHVLDTIAAHKWRPPHGLLDQLRERLAERLPPNQIAPASRSTTDAWRAAQRRWREHYGAST